MNQNHQHDRKGLSFTVGFIATAVFKPEVRRSEDIGSCGDAEVRARLVVDGVRERRRTLPMIRQWTTMDE